MLDWNGYRVLLSVVEQGSFSAAARHTGMSQPTVSRHIAALERTLGVRLVLRRKRGVALTPAGEQMMEDVRRMAQAAQAASLHGAHDTKEVDGVVRISCSETLGTLWLPHRLRFLRERHPRLRLDVSIDNAIVDLSKREADIALRLSRPKQPGLVARKFGALGFGLFASPGYLDARGTPRRLQDLAKHDVIGLVAGGPVPKAMQWLRQLVPAERFVLSANTLLAQQEAARAGWGIALAPAHLLEGDPRLRRVLPRAKPPSLDLWLVTHEDVRRSARVSVVVQALASTLSHERIGLSGGTGG
ncbi:MAG: LysR family transcriptional regulator [Myxococcales bacterium]